MIIKYQALIPHLQRNIKAVYVLVGHDHYLRNDAALNIKKNWRQRGETDEKIVHINMPADWRLLLEEANSYSLFSELVLLDIRFDKKTIDSLGKDILNQYLQNINPRCLIILQASTVPAKQLQWLTSNEHVVLVQVDPLSNAALQSWIAMQLTSRSIHYAAQVPTLIHQYTQNNMLACSQVIEKLALIHDATSELTVEDVNEQLIDQCEFQLYELADACLAANAVRAIHLLRQAVSNSIEPTLILWLLTQEIRQLIQLSHLMKQGTSFSNACAELRIWSNRAKLYQSTLTRVSLTQLYQLLQDSKRLDERIKTSQSHQIWHAFETLALSLCLGEDHSRG